MGGKGAATKEGRGQVRLEPAGREAAQSSSQDGGTSQDANAQAIIQGVEKMVDVVCGGTSYADACRPRKGGEQKEGEGEGEGVESGCYSNAAALPEAAESLSPGGVAARNELTPSVIEDCEVAMW